MSESAFTQHSKYTVTANPLNRLCGTIALRALNNAAIDPEVPL